MSAPKRWRQSHRFDRRALPLADRHYNRQKPGTPQFTPPGRTLVILADDESALWVSSWPKFARHAWPGAWVNTLFRNEGADLSSALITEAVAITRWKWPDVPDLGIITFVDPKQVKSSNPGYCYMRAGFEHEGYTSKGLRVLRLRPEAMPGPMEPLPMAGTMFVTGVAS